MRCIVRNSLDDALKAIIIFRNSQTNQRFHPKENNNYNSTSKLDKNMEKESKSPISEGLTLPSSSTHLEKPSPMKGHADKEGMLSALKLSVVSSGTPHSSA